MSNTTFAETDFDDLVKIFGSLELAQQALVESTRDPRTFRNMFETSLARVLVQYRILGRHLSIRKVLDLPADGSADTDPEIHITCKQILAEFDRLVATDPKLQAMEWTPILYHWELHEGTGRTIGDYGGMVFCDKTQTKYILIDPARQHPVIPFSQCEKYFTMMIRRNTLRLLALTEYLPVPDVEWIHATFVPTTDSWSLSPSIFQPGSASHVDSRIFKFTRQDLKPCLTTEELRRIDVLVKVFNDQPNASARSRVHLRPGEPDPSPIKFKRDFVGQSFQHMFSLKIERSCAGCKKHFYFDDLKACAACFMVMYCSSACQASKWDQHRHLCLKKRKKSALDRIQ